MSYKPPVCPECGKPVLTVDEILTETYHFNAESGCYGHREVGDEMDIRCGECGTDLVEIFEHGVCNYSAEQEE